MSLLSTEQKAAIDSGVFYVRQQWKLWFQLTPGGAWNRGVLIDDQQPATTARIIDAGSREVECYNQSLKERGDLLDGTYEFSADNNDGRFTIGKKGSIWWYEFLGVEYYFDPTEALLEHKIYLLVAGSWEELSFMTFRGSIKDIIFESVSNSSGESANSIARFICKNKGFGNIADRLWTTEDGTETSLISTFLGVADAAT